MDCSSVGVILFIMVFGEHPFVDINEVGKGNFQNTHSRIARSGLSSSDKVDLQVFKSFTTLLNAKWILAGIVSTACTHQACPTNQAQVRIKEFLASCKMLVCAFRCQYTFPPAVPASNDVKDLLQKIFVADAKHRINIDEIFKHPWFVKDIPPGVLDRSYLRQGISDQNAVKLNRIIKEANAMG